MNKISKDKKRADDLYFFDHVNRLLAVLIIVLLGNVVLKYYPSTKDLRTAQDDNQTNSMKIVSVGPGTKEVKPFSIYEQGLRRRDLFGPITKSVAADPETIKKTLPALHNRIKLLGILYDQNAKAIIEDLKEKQVHFLSKGESLGSILLEEIKEDKVVFQYDNERVEMTP